MDFETMCMNDLVTINKFFNDVLVNADETVVGATMMMCIDLYQDRSGKDFGEIITEIVTLRKDVWDQLGAPNFNRERKEEL